MSRSVTNAQLDRLFQQADKVEARQQGEEPSPPNPLDLLEEIRGLLKEVNERLDAIQQTMP